MSIIAPSRGDLESVHNNPFLGPKPSAMAPFGTSATLATHSTLDKTRIERLSQQDAIASITSWRKRVDNAPRVNESTRNERDRDALTPLNTNTSIPPRSGTLFKQPAKPSTLNSIPKPAAIPDVFEADHSQIRERSVSGKSVLNTINPNKRGREVVSNHVNGVKKVKTEHQSQEEAWRMKWLKIFPTLIFYFELGTEGAGKCYENRVKSMGAKVDAFFSSRVTHLVAKSIASPKKSIPPPISRKNAIKESSKNPFLDDTGAIDLVSKAEALGMKVWTVEKLLNMLNMLAPVDTPPQNDSLHTLLEDERIHGTRERDSTAPRPDHYYFKPGSKYILIEDATGRSRPIMMKECNVTKDGPEWPVLHERFLRPSSSNQCTIDPSKIRERAWCLYVERKPFEGEQPPNCDIKRSTSLRSLPSTPKLPVTEAMPYQNASGNSVVLTSNIASTSAANPSPGTYGQNAMGQYKDRALMQMNKRVQVLKGNARLAAAKRDSVTEANIAELTSRRASTGSTQSSAPVMPPKTFLSHFQLAGMLEQARQPIREKDISYEARMANRAKVESGSKGREQETAPGYCENCRMRYNDLSLHIISKKHRKFATSAENFASLDRLLIMLARPANPKLCQPDYPPCDAEHEKDDECECCARWNERLDEEIQGEVYEQSDGSGESEEFERQSEGSEEGTSQSEETDRLEGLTEQSGSPVSQQSGSEE